MLTNKDDAYFEFQIVEALQNKDADGDCENHALEMHQGDKCVTDQGGVGAGQKFHVTMRKNACQSGPLVGPKSSTLADRPAELPIARQTTSIRPLKHVIYAELSYIEEHQSVGPLKCAHSAGPRYNAKDQIGPHSSTMAHGSARQFAGTHSSSLSHGLVEHPLAAPLVASSEQNNGHLLIMDGCTGNGKDGGLFPSVLYWFRIKRCCANNDFGFGGNQNGEGLMQQKHTIQGEDIAWVDDGSSDVGGWDYMAGFDGNFHSVDVLNIRGVHVLENPRSENYLSDMQLCEVPVVAVEGAQDLEAFCARLTNPKLDRVDAAPKKRREGQGKKLLNLLRYVIPT
ncbi:Polyketide cyclase / dehydrase and lipid transport [Sesbania bispinosa]|nr:Polyketide cyclase / dehydrase and lipid transport [Sesbania bispinosa]